ncbi:MAG: secondary thiamine-phosphate synthase enzyme YjbQ [Candidatus Dormibacterales bacterium]
MTEIEVATGARQQMVDISDELQRAVASSGVADGLCHVFCPHTTCGLAVNEGHDPEVAADILAHLSRLVPAGASWRHLEGNADAHLKAFLAGADLTLPVAGGVLRLGRWQAVFLCEFDGPRRRQLWVTVR